MEKIHSLEILEILEKMEIFDILEILEILEIGSQLPIDYKKKQIKLKLPEYQMLVTKPIFRAGDL
jgi:hypothetical protein